MAGAELEPSMTKIKDETVTVMTPKGGSLKDYAYREAPYVFYRNGLYYSTLGSWFVSTANRCR